MYFADEQMPLRFCYRGPVFTNSSTLHQGRLREMTQMGVEYLNDDSAEADAEILALVINLMKRCGLRDFQVTIGTVPFFEALVKEAGIEEEEKARLCELLLEQNRFGASSMIEHLNIRKDLKDSFRRLPSLFVDCSVL